MFGNGQLLPDWITLRRDLAPFGRYHESCQSSSDVFTYESAIMSNPGKPDRPDDPPEIDPQSPPEIQPDAPQEIPPDSIPEITPEAPPEIAPDSPPEFKPGSPPEFDW